MIDIKNIHVCFEKGTPSENFVLRGINLYVKQGDWVNIVGGNGAGKTTFLNVLSGEIKPDQGQVLIDGVDVTYKEVHDRTTLVSRVFQDPMIGTCANLSIEENLTLAFLRGKQKLLRLALRTKLRKKICNVISDLGLGLENRLNDRMDMLSGGQRQALSLLMATVQSSKLLLLDEHTAALDPNMSKKIIEITEKLITRNNLTVIMITHSVDQAISLGSRTIVMNQGIITNDYVDEKRKKLLPLDLLAQIGGQSNVCVECE